MRAVDDALGQRWRYAAPHETPDIKAQRAAQTIHQQDSFAQHQLLQRIGKRFGTRDFADGRKQPLGADAGCCVQCGVRRFLPGHGD